MPNAALYIGGGLLAGIGQGMVEDGKAKREAALAELNRQFQAGENKKSRDLTTEQGRLGRESTENTGLLNRQSQKEISDANNTRALEERDRAEAGSTARSAADNARALTQTREEVAGRQRGIETTIAGRAADLSSRNDAYLERLKKTLAAKADLSDEDRQLKRELDAEVSRRLGVTEAGKGERNAATIAGQNTRATNANEARAADLKTKTDVQIRMAVMQIDGKGKQSEADRLNRIALAEEATRRGLDIADLNNKAAQLRTETAAASREKVAAATSGAPTAAQAANNTEIDAARRFLRGKGMEEQDIRRASEESGQIGRPNPDFDPNIQRIARIATQRKVGDDPDFESAWSRVFGEVSRTAPGIQGGVLPLPKNGNEIDYDKLEPWRTYDAEDGSISTWNGQTFRPANRAKPEAAEQSPQEKLKAKIAASRAAAGAPSPPPPAPPAPRAPSSAPGDQRPRSVPPEATWNDQAGQYQWTNRGGIALAWDQRGRAVKPAASTSAAPGAAALPAEPLSADDQASPIPDELIREGRQIINNATAAPAGPGAASQPGLSEQVKAERLQQARAAIQRGADRAAVEKRLIGMGIDPKGL